MLEELEVEYKYHVFCSGHNPGAFQVMQEVAQKDYAMLVRGADRAQHFIHYAPPRTLFAAEHLALYEEMREAQKQAMMAGANKQSFLYD